MKDKKGRPLFLLIDLELSCKRCKDKGSPERCTHRLKHLPPWKSGEKQEMMNALMADKKETLARENYGIVTDDGQSYIPKEAIDRWFELPRERITVDQDAQVIVVCVDPNDNAGKNASEMAIASIALCWGRMVVRFFFVCYCCCCCSPLSICGAAEACDCWYATGLGWTPPTVMYRALAARTNASGPSVPSRPARKSSTMPGNTLLKNQPSRSRLW